MSAPPRRSCAGFRCSTCCETHLCAITARGGARSLAAPAGRTDRLAAVPELDRLSVVGTVRAGRRRRGVHVNRWLRDRRRAGPPGRANAAAMGVCASGLLLRRLTPLTGIVRGDRTAVAALGAFPVKPVGLVLPRPRDGRGLATGAENWTGGTTPR